MRRSQLPAGWVTVAILALVAGLVAATGTRAATAQPQPPTGAEVNAALGVGVNLGNALEAPREGDWGLTIEADYFRLIAEAGFGHVRVPIKFSAYADPDPPYLIPTAPDPSIPRADHLWERVDWVIDQAEANDLYVIIDLHHYDELHDDVTGHRARFLAIWGQIASRYADAGPLVLFELLNEPAAQFIDDPTRWNTLLAEGLEVVRTTNPTRTVLVGPTRYNHIDALDDLVVPDDDYLIASVHFYEPFPFTHQGAAWVDPIPPAPVDWDADVFGLAAGWQDWSWDVVAAGTTEGYSVSFDRQYSGLQFARNAGFDPATLEIVGRGDVGLLVECAAGTDEAVEVAPVPLRPEGFRFEVDMGICPPDTTRILLLVVTETFADSVITQIQVCDADEECEEILQTGAERVASYFDIAEAWGELNGLAMNVGEFGAFGAEGVADIDERAEWTAAVREAAGSRSMSVTYWEFGAGFGVYDPAGEAWVPELLDALDVSPTVVGDGDVDCDGAVDLVDAVVLAQYTSGGRSDSGGCPLGDIGTQLNLDAADVDGSGTVDSSDVLRLLACRIGLPVSC